MSDKNANEIRKRELAQIHIARQQLGMDDETYRNVLWTVARVRSSADLDWPGRKHVLDHMKACGFKVKSRRLPSAHRPLAMTKEEIEAKIATQLKKLDKNWPYAYGVGRRIFPGISRFEFLTKEQLGEVSSALERTIRFKRKKEAANG